MREVNSDDKRQARKKRRVRAQIISYSILALFLILIGLGCFTGVRFFQSWQESRNSAAAVDEIAVEDTDDTTTETEEADPAEEETDAEEVVTEPETDPLEDYIAELISQMTLEEKVAGMFLVSPESITGVSAAVKAGSGTQAALEEYAVGGFVYTKKNIQSGDQFKEMIETTSEMTKYPMFYAVYEEGGDVTSLSAAGLDVESFDTMAEIGETGDTANAYALGNGLGTYLSEYGINLDLAPVADLVEDTSTSSMGTRSFGSDATIVSAMVSSEVQGLQDAGVSVALKHFPGQGLATENTETSYAELSTTYEEMKTNEFLPFIAGIDVGAEFVIVSHVAYPEITGSTIPASLSESIVTTILRQDLGFEGVIMTDALDKAAITEYYPTNIVAVKAVQAGIDLLVLPDDFETAYQAILDAVNDGTITEERINESITRIFRVKYKDYLD